MRKLPNEQRIWAIIKRMKKGEHPKKIARDIRHKNGKPVSRPLVYYYWATYKHWLD